MEMDLDQFIIADSQKAVALKMFVELVADHVFVQILTLDQKLCIISEFKHNYPPKNIITDGL